MPEPSRVSQASDSLKLPVRQYTKKQWNLKTKGPRRYARAIIDLETRVDIAKRIVEGETWEQIAEALQIPVSQCQRYYAVSEQRYEDLRDALRQSGRKGFVSDHLRSLGPGSRLPSSPILVTSGTVMDSPEDAVLKRQILDLRKRAIPYDIIAEQLGISDKEAKDLGRAAIMALGGDEVQDVELARRLQVEQIDAMIQGIYSPATNGILEAIDRMIKLLDSKAKLLGLNAPQKIDIESRIIHLAEYFGADPQEIREIADEVLADYPGLRSGR